MNLAWELLKWGLQVKIVGFGSAHQAATQKTGPGARTQSAFEEWARPVHDDFGGIEGIARPQTFAVLAGAVDAIKRKRPGLEHRDVDAAFHAGRLLRIQVLLPVDHGHLYQALGELNGSFNRSS